MQLLNIVLVNVYRLLTFLFLLKMSLFQNSYFSFFGYNKLTMKALLFMFL